MEFTRLVAIVGDESVFETGLLLAGDMDPAHVRRQLSRWVRAGRTRSSSPTEWCPRPMSAYSPPSPSMV